MILEKRTTEIQALIFNGLFKPYVLKKNILLQIKIYNNLNCYINEFIRILIIFNLLYLNNK